MEMYIKLVWTKKTADRGDVLVDRQGLGISGGDVWIKDGQVEHDLDRCGFPMASSATCILENVMISAVSQGLIVGEFT